MEYEPRIVGFEGLHRSGKGTQIDFLKDYLIDKGHFVRVVRGQGTREGVGNKPYDFPSAWWQENRKRILEEGILEATKCQICLETFDRIQRELRFYIGRKFRDEFLNSGLRAPYILMDRTYLSTWFVLNQVHSTDIDFIRERKFRGNNGPVLPDLTFLLDVDKETLLHRCAINADEPEKTNFRIQNIKSNYDLYARLMMDIAKKDSGVFVLNGSLNPKHVHANVIDKLRYHGF